MRREVHLIETASGFIAHKGLRCYTMDPERAVSFVDVDVAHDKCREFSRFTGMAATPVPYSQLFPRPLPLSHDDTKIN